MEQFYSQVNVRVFKLSQAPIRLYRESYLLVQPYDFDGKIPFLTEQMKIYPLTPSSPCIVRLLIFVSIVHAFCNVVQRRFYCAFRVAFAVVSFFTLNFVCIFVFLFVQGEDDSEACHCWAADAFPDD
jgi:hypothetical protein